MKVIPDCHFECNAKALISALRDKGEEAISRGYTQEHASLVLTDFLLSSPPSNSTTTLYSHLPGTIKISKDIFDLNLGKGVGLEPEKIQLSCVTSLMT